MKRIVPEKPPDFKETASNLALDLFAGAGTTADLYSAAMGYLADGLSPIPLRGDLDPSASKLPTTSWKQYQQRPATDDELRTMFVDRPAGGVAVVCGDVSMRVVVDFDSPDGVKWLRENYPHLLDTFTVLSGWRRLRQFHYQLSPDMAGLQSKRFKGRGDLLANGAYVVMPPTAIDGGQWMTINHTAPMTITRHDLDILLQALAGGESTDSSTPVVPVSRVIGEQELIDAYRAYLTSYSRNESLYRAALFHARAAGWTAEKTLGALAVTFIQTAAPAGHRAETDEQRYSEAERTVYSAFNARYNSAAGRYVEVASGLPNSAREYLLQSKLTHVARVIDALLLAGWAAGAVFTEPEAVAVCRQYKLSRKSIHAALTCEVLAVSALPRDLQQPSRAEKPKDKRSSAAKDESNYVPIFPVYTSEALPTELCSVRVKNGDIIQRGRKPSMYYVMPDVVRVCALLGVPLTPSDRLDAADLHSAKAYRVALHRALVARRENKEMARYWLAERLGVSVRTCQAYDELAGVEALESFARQLVTWLNIEAVVPLEDEWAHPSAFLEVDGQRMPPRRAIALKALGGGSKVEYVRRTANRYRLKQEAAEDGTPDTTEPLSATVEGQSPGASKLNPFSTKRGNDDGI